MGGWVVGGGGGGGWRVVEVGHTMRSRLAHVLFRVLCPSPLLLRSRVWRARGGWIDEFFFFLCVVFFCCREEGGAGDGDFCWRFLCITVDTRTP